MGDELDYFHRVLYHSPFVFCSDERPRSALPYKHATPSDSPWPIRGLQKPASATWPVLLSAAQIWELLEGTNGEDYGGDNDGGNSADSKWFIYSTFAYADTQPYTKAKPPKNVNGTATVHVCSRLTYRQLYQLTIEIEYVDAVARSHPSSLQNKFEFASMICGIVREIAWETDDALVGAATEANAKKDLVAICASALSVHLLVQGTEPIRYEDRSSAQRLRDAARQKLDLQMAMNRLRSRHLRLLTGGGGAAMAALMGRGLPGRTGTKALPNAATW